MARWSLFLKQSLGWSSYVEPDMPLFLAFHLHKPSGIEIEGYGERNAHLPSVWQPRVMLALGEGHIVASLTDRTNVACDSQYPSIGLAASTLTCVINNVPGMPGTKR